MKSELKKKWLTALNSGKYKQGQEELLYIDIYGDKCYCCLGVLCNLWAKEKHKKMSICDEDGGQLPPKKVLDWAGLSEDESHSLANINDDYDIDQFKRVSEEIKSL